MQGASLLRVTRNAEPRSNVERTLDEARNVFKRQAAAVADLATRLDRSFHQAVEMLLHTRGRIVVSGMGKSGNIGKKLSSTFASTGAPSFFLHPAEALHGDLVMVTRGDTILAISYGGETEEVVRLIPYLRELEVPIIALVGDLDSTVARHADLALDVSVEREVCPNNLAPTSSTLAALAMGDALAVCLMRKRNFRSQDFARFHPGGSLGRRLLTRVRDVMHEGPLPIVAPDDTVGDSLLTITEGRLGLALVMQGHRLVGIVTDGDLRRALQEHDDLLATPMHAIMNPDPKVIDEDAMLTDAEERMQVHKIKALVVQTKFGRVAGVLEIFQD